MTEGFLLDQGRCTGCSACRLGCTIENGLDWDRSWRRVHTGNPQRLEAGATLHLSSACHHCERAACLAACPARAIRHDEASGAVLLDDADCIGCGYCSWACPYDAPLFDHARGVMSKCTSCPERRAGGLEPACVSACPTGALEWGELDRGQALEPLLTATRLQPRFRVIPPLGGPGPGDPFQPGAATAPLPAGGPNGAPITLRSEWPLAVFTLVAGLLAAWAAAADWMDRPIELLPFGGLAAAATVLAGLHLGSPRRAWRAVLNPRRSWLSREVLAWNLLVVLGLYSAHRGPADQTAAGAAALAGLLTLVCVDGVYRVLRRAGPRGPHSAGAVLSGLFLFALLARLPALLVALVLARAFLFARRLQSTRPPGWLAWIALRQTALLAGLAVLDPWRRAVPFGWLLAVVLVGEAIDRGFYYTELRRREARP